MSSPNEPTPSAEELLKIVEKHTPSTFNAPPPELPHLTPQGASPAQHGSAQHGLSFTGNAKDFFNIWIVNTFLNVITLGFYSPWAKIRTKRYFYGHTSLDGHTFDYVADPLTILKGRLLIMALLVMLYAGALINPIITLVGWLVVFAMSPWAIVKSLSFNLKSTTHRGVRFGFVGQTGELTGLFFMGGLLQAITLGLYAPIFARELINFKLKNTRYGDQPFRFTQAPGFYLIYAAPALIYILVLLVLIGLLGVFGFLSNSDGAFIINATLYLLIAVTAGLIQGGTFNYVAQNLTMEGVRFSSTLNKGEFAWLYFTNLLAVVGTLGLALPWAIVRAHAYKVSHFYVHIDDPRVMDRIRSAAQREGSGVGDAATDLMDIEVGI